MGPFEVLPGPTRKCLRVVRFGSVGRVGASVPVEPKVRRGPCFFYFYIFQNCFLQKYIFDFIIYRFIPYRPAAGRPALYCPTAGR